jgi:hypothetical protein
MYVMGQTVTVNLILRNLDFEGFAIYSPYSMVIKFSISEEQQDYIKERLEEACHVTLRFALSDQQVDLLETSAMDLDNADLLFSMVRGGKVVDAESTDFYVWSRAYGFRED